MIDSINQLKGHVRRTWPFSWIRFSTE